MSDEQQPLEVQLDIEAASKISELEIARLNMLLKPCEKHNFAAYITIDEDGVWVITNQCSCAFYLSQFDTPQDGVNYWNERPYFDKVMNDYAKEIMAHTTLAAAYRTLREDAYRMAKLIKSVHTSNSVDIMALTNGYTIAQKVILQTDRDKAQEEEQRKAAMGETYSAQE